MRIWSCAAQCSPRRRRGISPASAQHARGLCAGGVARTLSPPARGLLHLTLGTRTHARGGARHPSCSGPSACVGEVVSGRLERQTGCWRFRSRRGSPLSFVPTSLQSPSSMPVLLSERSSDPRTVNCQVMGRDGIRLYTEVKRRQVTGSGCARGGGGRSAAPVGGNHVVPATLNSAHRQLAGRNRLLRHVECLLDPTLHLQAGRELSEDVQHICR